VRPGGADHGRLLVLTSWIRLQEVTAHEVSEVSRLHDVDDDMNVILSGGGSVFGGKNRWVDAHWEEN
jgi:hypothetical protein